jgi:hypothetical protein
MVTELNLIVGLVVYPGMLSEISGDKSPGF